MSSPLAVTVNPMGLVPEGIDIRYGALFDSAPVGFLKVVGEDTRLYQLVQLALGSAPFTECEKEIFETARKTEAYSEKWLGVAGYATILIAPVIATILSFLPWDEMTEKPLGSVEKLSIAVCLASLAVVISAGLGMKYTGTNPKRTSDVHNTDQAIMLLAVKARFDELADFIVASYQRDDEALKGLVRWCARQIVGGG